MSSNAAPGTPRARVWILEDSRVEAKVAVAALGARCDPEVFSDGGALLERLAADIPDVLVLDWILPGLSGIEVCRFVRETRDKLQLPILMLTANTSEESLLEGLSSGANDFVTKPFRAPELAARVEILAGMSRLARETREREEQTAALAREAERAAAVAHAEGFQKDKYISILGHDLRNPLSAISVAVQLIERRPEEAGQSVQIIRHSATRMAMMIRDLLDFARGRLAAGIPLALAPADLGRICTEVVSELSTANPGRQIDLHLAGNLAGTWDSDRLEQAISNLLGNALEHSDGAVSIAATGDDSGVTVEVRNAGPGIPATELPRLFEPFRKREEGKGGLGLGLYIAREIVRPHGGELTVKSIPDRETSFTLNIPRRPPG
jgi:signal transduction histidine kinase